MTSNDVFLGGGSNSGSIVSAELPNIIGKTGYYQRDGGNNPFNLVNFNYQSEWEESNRGTMGGFEGAFSIEKTSLPNCQRNVFNSQETANYFKRWTFDASRSNSLYRNNGKLIPKHYTVEFWIKYK